MRLIDADKIIFREIDEIGGEYEPYLGCSKSQIDSLPSITLQEPKTGHWIRVTDKAGHLVWECDNCGWQQRFNTNFCPDCGVKMVEPQGSEDNK